MRRGVGVVGLFSVFLVACVPDSPGGGLDAGEPPDAGSDGGLGDPATWRWSLSKRKVAGEAYVQPTHLTDDGVVIGYAGPGEWDPTSVPVRLSSSSATVLKTPERNWGYAHGGNAQVTVGEWHWQPQSWSGDVRTTLHIPEGWFSGVARAVNAAGLVVGSFRDYDDSLATEPGPRPVAWPTATTMVELRHDGGEDALGAARAVNDAGLVAGYVRLAAGMRAVWWDGVDASAVAYAVPEGADGCEAYGLGEDGDAAGRCVFGLESRATLFRKDGAAEVLASPPVEPGWSEAHDVDAHGRVVGFARVAEGVVHGQLWFGEERIDLNDRLVGDTSGLVITHAIGIDTAGRVAVQVREGTGVDATTYAALLEPAE